MRAGGHFAYFTIQAMAICTVYHAASALAELTGFLPLLRICYSSAIFVDAMGCNLTLLWYMLNWREPKWQALCKAWEAEGVRPFAFQTTVHTHSLLTST